MTEAASAPDRHPQPSPDPTLLLLVRHGQTFWNADGRIQGHTDTPLSELGAAQARMLAQRLARQPIDAVWSSDLTRAMDTARPIATARGLPIRPEPRLRERSFGMFEGHTYGEAEARWPTEFAAWRRREPTYAVPGGESYLQLRERVLAALTDLCAAHPGQTVLALAHGGVLDAIYRAARAIPWETPRAHKLPNAGLNRLHLRLPGPKLEILEWEQAGPESRPV